MVMGQHQYINMRQIIRIYWWMWKPPATGKRNRRASFRKYRVNQNIHAMHLQQQGRMPKPRHINLIIFRTFLKRRLFRQKLLIWRYTFIWHYKFICFACVTENFKLIFIIKDAISIIAKCTIIPMESCRSYLFILNITSFAYLPIFQPVACFHYMIDAKR